MRKQTGWENDPWWAPWFLMLLVPVVAYGVVWAIQHVEIVVR